MRGHEDTGSQQLELPGFAAPLLGGPPAKDRDVPLASHQPIARVLVEVSSAHLDHPFDYGIPASMDHAAQAGVRVRVRFNGKLMTGFITERIDASDHAGQLSLIQRVVSPHPVLTDGLRRLIEKVAARYAGTRADVMRLAIPARHAKGEAQALRLGVVKPGELADPELARETRAVWEDYAGGTEMWDSLAAGGRPRAAWEPLPWCEPNAKRPGWLAGIAASCAATALSGRRTLIVVPDERDVRRVVACLEASGLGPVGRLVAEDGPMARQEAFTAAQRGALRVLVGTRSAAFAPVAELGLVVCWDDDSETLVDRHAPYPQAREVLSQRVAVDECGLLLASHGRSVRAQQLVESGWLGDLRAHRTLVRDRTVRVSVPDREELGRDGASSMARIPPAAHRMIRVGLQMGPVLVQVARSGYLPALACASCRTPARCPLCGGPLGLSGKGAAPQCAWCGSQVGDFSCENCGEHKLRSMSVGLTRTAEELGRAFPGIRVRVSGANPGVVDKVSAEPALVIATPGSEPVAQGGYAAVVILDAAASSGRAALEAGVHSLQRWLAAATLARPAQRGGAAGLFGDPAPTEAQALVRWDPVGYAARELTQRAVAGLPPARRFVELRGARVAVQRYVERLELPAGCLVVEAPPLPQTRGQAEAELTLAPGKTIGNDPDDEVRALLSGELRQSPALLAELKRGNVLRAAHRDPGVLRLQVDPIEIA